MEIVPNWKRVYGNFALLWPAYRAGEFPYLPEHLSRVPHRMVSPEQMPDWTANDWFFLTHLLRGKVESHMATGRAIALRQRRPELFDPERAIRLTVRGIDYRLKQVFGTVPAAQRYGEAWRRNAEILLAWGGDIRTVFRDVATEAEVRARVMNKEKYDLPLIERGFYGFQAKMTALLAINLMRGGFIHRISMSFPVDFHHMRAILGTGMIQVPNGQYRPSVVEAVCDRIGRAYLDRFPDVDPVEFSELLFVLSRAGCKWAVAEPNPDWDDPRVLGRYLKSCGRCPLEDRCQQTVSSDGYYVRDGSKGERVLNVIDRPKPPRRVIRLLAA